jgi:hypothetical protein
MIASPVMPAGTVAAVSSWYWMGTDIQSGKPFSHHI